MPRLLDPLGLLTLASRLPREAALVVFIGSLVLLVLGLRGSRVVLCLAAAGAGALCGAALARLMYVAAWTVAVPAALLGAVGAWRITRYLLVLVGALLCGVAGGTVARGLDLAEYSWPALGAGAVVGALATVIMPRFVMASSSALLGSAGVLATVGALVRAPDGPFAPGAWARHPVAFTVAGATLMLLSLVVQVSLGEEHHDQLAGSPS